MSWRDAPLYVRCHDLARDLLTRLDPTPSAPWPTLRASISSDALALLRSVSVALSFPARRAVALACADESVVALKVSLRLAAELGTITEGGARQAGEALVEIGRMIGGWRRRKLSPPSKTEPGAEPTLPPGA